MVYSKHIFTLNHVGTALLYVHLLNIKREVGSGKFCTAKRVLPKLGVRGTTLRVP